VFAEVDDMAMLRLLARDSGAVALLPAVVVQDELRAGSLQQYCTVPRVHENFYAITTERRFQPALLRELLRAA
jgi:LysR family transcriptional activator of nhaA